MKILVDENIPLMTVRGLKELGHDVKDLRSTDQEGSADTEVWAMAQQEQRLLVTTDKGFAQYRDKMHQGILIVRLKQPNRRKIHERVLQAITQFEPQQWEGLTVVMRDSVQSISHARE